MRPCGESEWILGTTFGALNIPRFQLSISSSLGTLALSVAVSLGLAQHGPRETFPPSSFCRGPLWPFCVFLSMRKEVRTNLMLLGECGWVSRLPRPGSWKTQPGAVWLGLCFNTTVYTAEEAKRTSCLLFRLSRLFLHSAHLSPSHWASPSFLRKKDTNNPPVTGWVS